MRALTLTQPWAGLVASGIKLVENRPLSIVKAEDVGKRFAIHASREIDDRIYQRIVELAPELGYRVTENGKPDRFAFDVEQRWFQLSRIKSAVIAVATLDKAFRGWDAESIAKHGPEMCFSNGTPLGPAQLRFFFGPIVYALRDVVALPTPVPCRGWQGFWTLAPELERAVVKHLPVEASS